MFRTTNDAIAPEELLRRCTGTICHWMKPKV